MAEKKEKNSSKEKEELNPSDQAGRDEEGDKDTTNDSQDGEQSIEIPEGVEGTEHLKFWQKNDLFRSLLDPEVVKELDLTKYDLAKLLKDFFGEMFKEEYIDFRVSGIAIHSAAKIHRLKITEVLEEQLREEQERKKEALRRQIPSSISQPLRGGRQIATKDDFMGAMRRAIIEVMRKREKQQQRMDKKRKTAPKKKIKVKKKLPEGIRKAILGKERIEETFDRWYSTIRQKLKESPEGEISYFDDLKPMVQMSNAYLHRFEHARLFMSLLFLRNRSKIDLKQHDELTDILVAMEKRK